MNNDLQIEKLLKNLPTFQVGSVVNAEILKALQNRRLEAEVREEFRPSAQPFNFLTLFTMNTRKWVALFAVLILMVVGTFSYQLNSYAYHLGKARTALGELQAVLKGQAPVSFIPRAWAEGSAVDEAAVTQLTTTVVDETEAAIEIVEETSDAHLLETALEEIHAVQEESLGVLGEAVQVVENPEAVVTVVAAIETVAQQQEQVQENLEVVAVAIAEAQEEPVAIEVTTTADVEAALEAEEAAAELTEEEPGAPELAPETPATEEEGEGTFKVDVCHFRGQERQIPHTLTVAGPAVRAHLNHGDTLGPCAAPSAEEVVSEEEQQAYLTEWKKHSHEKALEAHRQAAMERKERAEEKMEAMAEFATKVRELAESEGVEVSAESFARHEALLQEARKAYEAGNPKLARTLVEESKELFKKMDELEEVTERAEETHKKEWLEKREGAEREHWAEKVKHGLEQASERLEDIQAKAKEAGLELPSDQLEQARSALAQGREAFVAGQFEAVEKSMERFSQAYEWLYGALRRLLDPKRVEVKGEAEIEFGAEVEGAPVVDFDLKIDHKSKVKAEKERPDNREQKEWMKQEEKQKGSPEEEIKKKELWEAEQARRQTELRDHAPSEADKRHQQEEEVGEREREREAEQKKREWLQNEQEREQREKAKEDRGHQPNETIAPSPLEPKAEPAPAPTEPSAESTQPQPSSSDHPAEGEWQQMH